MAAYIRQRPAAWFMPVALLAVLWGLAGCYAFYAQAFGHADEAQALIANVPEWLILLYGAATVGGLLGAVALARRSLWARPLFVLSLVAVVATFACLLLATDLIAVRGVTSVIFPLLVALVTSVELWFSAWARRRGWIA